MKRRLIAALCTAMITMLLFIPSTGNAEKVSIGATSFLSWWAPSFQDKVLGKKSQISTQTSYYFNRNFSMAPSFLVGPSLSLPLTGGFSIASSFLWGKWFHSDPSYDCYDIGSGQVFQTMKDIHIKKWELSILLNYALNDLLMLFAGISYQGYNSSVISVTPRVIPSFAVYSSPTKHQNYQSGWGPAIGARLNIHLWGPIYLLTDASILYLPTRLRTEFYTICHHSQVYHSVGFNGTTSLAFNIEPASVTVSLGFRYQYLHYMLWDSRSNDWYYQYSSYSNVLPLNNQMNDDHSYGITLSATYSFERYRGRGQTDN